METVTGTDSADDFTNTDSSTISFSDATFDLLAGDDTVRSAVMGDSTVLGGAGDDLLDTTSTTRTRFEGGADNDTLDTTNMRDSTMLGDAGDDLLQTTGMTDSRFEGGLGNDTLNSTELEFSTVLGGDGADQINATQLNEVSFDGGAGDDRIEATQIDGGRALGGAGNDIFGGTRLDDGLIDMGADDDRVDIERLFRATVIGGSGDDTIEGLIGDLSVIDGGDGADQFIFAETQDSTITGGDGADSVSIDVIGGGSVDVGAGDDVVTLSEAQNVTITGGDGTDRLVFVPVAPNENETGLEFAVVNTATEQADGSLLLSVDYINRNTDSANWNKIDMVAVGFEEFDVASDLPEGGFVTLSRAEVLEQWDGTGDTLLQGTQSGDVILGTPTSLEIQGLGGNDWITPGAGFVRIDGGDGTDMVSFIDLGGRINLFERSGVLTVGEVTLANVENVTGTSFVDILSGTAGDNHLRGMGSVDVFVTSGGADTLDGGTGQDRLWIREAEGVDANDTISLLRGTGWAGDAAGTTLIDIENVESGIGDDMLTGDRGGNELDAGLGDDTLMGNAGDDILKGGLGQDVALFNYAQDQYEIEDAGTGLVEVTYIGAGAGDGYDRLLNIEVLSFADGDVIL